LNDVERQLSEGDNMVNNWQNGNEGAVRDLAGAFANNSGNQRNRLKELLGTYQEFSDLSVVDPATLDKLAMFADNLYKELVQLPVRIWQR
jgi:hypothetical protein